MDRSRSLLALLVPLGVIACGARSALVGGEGAGVGGVGGAGSGGGGGAGGGGGPPGVVACSPGDPAVVLASDAWYTFDGLEVDGEHVYYTTKDGVARVPKLGGVSELVAAKQLASYIGTFALTPTDVYSAHGTAGYGIARTAKADLAISSFSPPFAAFTIRADGPWLFTIDGPNDDLSVRRVANDGTALETVAEHLGNDAEFFRVAGLSIFYGRSPTNDIVQAGLGGGEVVVVEESNRLLGVDEGHVYFDAQNLTGAGLGRVSLAGGELVSYQVEFVSDLAFDADHAYFTDAVNGIIGSVPKDGAPSKVLFSAVNPQNIAVDGSCVFWFDLATQPDGVLMRGPKG